MKLFAIVFTCCALMTGVANAEEKIKVFILAGQSNMEGHGIISKQNRPNNGMGTLEFAASDQATKGLLTHTVKNDGSWLVRDDVQIWYFERSGGLSAGFGANEEKIGPEFGFGHRVGEAIDGPVLLIKTAWGGKSLAVDFRPPSSGGDVGPYYKEMLKHVRSVLGDIQSVVPNYKGNNYEISGFAWHQGWNDRVNQKHNDEYEVNLANFIRDIRKEFKSPKLPFVIAETGMSGASETHPRALSLMKAQAAVAEYDEFKGNIAFVGTKAFYRPKEESPSGQAYHWNTNALTYFLIGDAMGKAMLELQSP